VGRWVSGARFLPAALELEAASLIFCVLLKLCAIALSAPFPTLQEVAEKETIAGELAVAEPRLLTTHRGPLLLRRCHVDAYKKGSEGWQQRVVAADAARREFEDLFGEAEAGAGAGGAAEGAAAGEVAGQAEEGGKAKKAKKGRKAAAAASAAAVEGEQQLECGEQQAGGSGTKSKQKKRQQREEVAAAAEKEEQQQEEAAQPGDGDGGGKAKKPRKKAAEQQGAEAVDDIMAQLGESCIDCAWPTLLCPAGSGCPVWPVLVVSTTALGVLTAALMCAMHCRLPGGVQKE
jgi:hypothetical protein